MISLSPLVITNYCENGVGSGSFCEAPSRRSYRAPECMSYLWTFGFCISEHTTSEPLACEPTRTSVYTYLSQVAFSHPLQDR